MNKLVIFISLAFLFCYNNLMAEEFVPKRASIEQNGQKTEVKDVKGLPTFHADYYSDEDVVKISSSAGHLTLKKGTFFYSCRGMRNGLLITATAHVNNGKIEKIVYEEYDSSRNITATTTYFKK